jgi:hypothetical protein
MFTVGTDVDDLGEDPPPHPATATAASASGIRKRIGTAAQ